MTERDMVMDVLTGVKGCIATYAKCITESEDLNLRQTFQQMRDSAEKFQYDLYKIAEKKGYYITCPKETENQCQNIKVELTDMLATHKTSGPIPVMS